MKFVITGASTYGVSNMGDDAMLLNLVQGLKAEYPDCSIDFLCRHPSKKYDEEFGFKSVKNLDHDSKEAAAGRLFLGMNSDDNPQNLIEINEIISNADLLIIGGNSFMEIFKNEFLRGVSSYSSTLAILAKFHNIPFALYGLNIVSRLKDATTIQHAKFLCENAKSITFREESGLNFLKELEIKNKNMHILGDPAYGMSVSINKEKISEILKRNHINLKSDRPIIGLAIRHEYWQGTDEDYIKFNVKFASIIDQLITLHNFQFLFIPNCTYTKGNKWQDDRLTHKSIFEQIKNKNSVYEISEELTVRETYMLFSILDIHISNRRHSSIFAAMNNIPFISIDSCFEGHMSPLLVDLGMEDQLIHHGNLDSLVKKVSETVNNKKQIKKILLSRVREIKDLSQRHVPIILKDSL